MACYIVSHSIFLYKCCDINGTNIQCTSFRFRYLYEKDDVIGLEIRKVEASDEGEYKCVAFNKSGKAECKCNIYVDGRLHRHSLYFKFRANITFSFTEMVKKSQNAR